MVLGKDDEGLSTKHLVGVPMMEGDGLVLVVVVSVSDVEVIDVATGASVVI
jgi:hypothetical protein